MEKSFTGKELYKKEFDDALDTQLKSFLIKEYSKIKSPDFKLEDFTVTSIKAYIAIAVSSRLKQKMIDVYSADINVINSSFEDLIELEYNDGLPQYDEEYIINTFYDFVEEVYYGDEFLVEEGF